MYIHIYMYIYKILCVYLWWWFWIEVFGGGGNKPDSVLCLSAQGHFLSALSVSTIQRWYTTEREKKKEFFFFFFPNKINKKYNEIERFYFWVFIAYRVALPFRKHIHTSLDLVFGPNWDFKSYLLLIWRGCFCFFTFSFWLFLIFNAPKPHFPYLHLVWKICVEGGQLVHMREGGGGLWVNLDFREWHWKLLQSVIGKWSSGFLRSCLILYLVILL